MQSNRFFGKLESDMANAAIQQMVREESAEWERILRSQGCSQEVICQRIEKMKLSFQVDCIRRIQAEYPKALRAAVAEERAQTGAAARSNPNTSLGEADTAAVNSSPAQHKR